MVFLTLLDLQFDKHFEAPKPSPLTGQSPRVVSRDLAGRRERDRELRRHVFRAAADSSEEGKITFRLQHALCL